MPYTFSTIIVSDRKIGGIHTFWGTGPGGWNPIIGMKQIEAPYLYGYAVRIRGRFLGLCRERTENRDLVRPLDIDTQEIKRWGFDADNQSDQPSQVTPPES